MFSPKSPNVSRALAMDNVRAFLLLGGRPRAVYAQAFHRFSHIIHSVVHKLSTRVPAAFEGHTKSARDPAFHRLAGAAFIQSWF